MDRGATRKQAEVLAQQYFEEPKTVYGTGSYAKKENRVNVPSGNNTLVLEPIDALLDYNY